MSIIEKYKFKKVKNYVHDLIHQLTSISMELEDIKNFFHQEGFRYVGKRQLQIPKYIFNLLFILFYHPRYGFIVTVCLWEPLETIATLFSGVYSLTQVLPIFFHCVFK